MNQPQYFFMLDIETDGSVAGISNMLSFGVVVLTEDGKRHGHFSANLHTLSHLRPNPETIAFWKQQPLEAWQECRHNAEPPAEVMPRFVEWVNSFEGEKVLVSDPGVFDASFLFYYLAYFNQTSPFKHRALDVRTFQMAVLGSNFLQSGVNNTPEEFRAADRPHTHVALEDAAELGERFLNLLAYSRTLQRTLSFNGGVSGDTARLIADLIERRIREAKPGSPSSMVTVEEMALISLNKASEPMIGISTVEPSGFATVNGQTYSLTRIPELEDAPQEEAA